MRKSNLTKYLIAFLSEATQNQSELKYIIFNYLHGVIFAVVLWNYVIFELCFGVNPFWVLCFAVIAFGIPTCRKSDVESNPGCFRCRKLSVHKCSVCSNLGVARVSRQNGNECVKGCYSDGSHIR